MRSTLCLAGCLLLAVAFALAAAGRPRAAAPPTPSGDRSPIDLALSADERWLVTANASAGTVSLIDWLRGRVVDEVEVGPRPAAVALSPDGRRVLATSTHTGELTILHRVGQRLLPSWSLWLGHEPRGIAIAADGKRAYVALTTAHAVAVVDLVGRRSLGCIAAGCWPRFLALTPDGRRLAVAASGSGGVTILDTRTAKPLYPVRLAGINLGQVQVSRDGLHAYLPWTVYRERPITAENIRRGWVLGSRIARIRIDEQAPPENLTLDVDGRAAADPHGLALSPDEKRLVCSASGTQELLVYRLRDLPWSDVAPGDHLHADLLKDRDRFDRIPLGGRPTALRFARDGRVLVANYLRNSVQVVDCIQRKVVREIAVGAAPRPSLARQGEAIFFDGRRTLDGWYSCHSCHFEGGTNAVTMDTNNDDRQRTYKAVLPLFLASRTGPWFWHGNEKDLGRAIHRSLTSTLFAKAPSDQETQALAAYLRTLTPPPNPNRLPNGELSEAAARGATVFRGARAGCSRCHSGPLFTDQRVHHVGTGSPRDSFPGFRTPSLLGVYSRLRFLHDGRATSLEDVLLGDHAPERVTRKGKLTAQEMHDLLDYLRSL